MIEGSVTWSNVDVMMSLQEASLVAAVCSNTEAMSSLVGHLYTIHCVNSSEAETVRALVSSIILTQQQVHVATSI
jgi:hypothetical protein